MTGLAEHTWGSAGAHALVVGCGVCGGWAAWMRWCWITNLAHNPTRYRATIYRCLDHGPAATGEPADAQPEDPHAGGDCRG